MSESLESLKQRKGARKIASIPEEVLHHLNKGELETVNLTEWLAVDQKALLSHVLSAKEFSELRKACLQEMESIKKPTAMKSTEVIGKCLLQNQSPDFFKTLKVHNSDSVRCWAATMAGYNEKSSLKKKLKEIQAFALDEHFGVREIAWMAVRSDIATDVKSAIEILSPWSQHKSHYVRRFASEATRPRGVWAAHIEELKNSPELALPILEPLKSDESKYVQDSVGNWLNDASKSQPDWVKEITSQWLKESTTPQTKKNRRARTANNQ